MAAAEATKALGKAADPEAAKAAADTLKRMEKHLEAQSWVDTVIEQDGLYRTGERRAAPAARRAAAASRALARGPARRETAAGSPLFAAAQYEYEQAKKDFNAVSKQVGVLMKASLLPLAHAAAPSRASPANPRLALATVRARVAPLPTCTGPPAPDAGGLRARWATARRDVRRSLVHRSSRAVGRAKHRRRHRGRVCR